MKALTKKGRWIGFLVMWAAWACINWAICRKTYGAWTLGLMGLAANTFYFITLTLLFFRRAQ